jgi:hypothetical protein
LHGAPEDNIVVEWQEPLEGPVSRENHMDTSLVRAEEESDGILSCLLIDRDSIIYILELNVPFGGLERFYDLESNHPSQDLKVLLFSFLPFHLLFLFFFPIYCIDIFCLISHQLTPSISWIFLKAHPESMRTTPMITDELNKKGKGNAWLVKERISR